MSRGKIWPPQVGRKLPSRGVQVSPKEKDAIIFERDAQIQLRLYNLRLAEVIGHFPVAGRVSLL
jgi:hypothetical protein